MDAVRLEGLPKESKKSSQRIEQIAGTKHPETKQLRQVSGVGPLIALTFVLTIEDPARFEKRPGRRGYVGLRPKRSESGESQPQLRITKEGYVYLTKLPVQDSPPFVKSF